MSEFKHSHQVTVFGETFSIKADVPEEAIRDIAHYVEGKILEIRKSSMSTDKFRMAVLAAMNIAGEYYELKLKLDEYAEHFKGIESRAKDLTASLDGATNSV